MNSLKLSLLLLKRDFKNFFLYTCSSIIIFMVLFGIFNIIYDPNIKSNLSQGDYISLSSIHLIVLFIIMLIGYYYNNLFMEKRKKEIAVQIISGLSLNSLAFSTAVINIIISLISLIFGLLFGFLLSPLVLSIIYNVIGINNTSFSLTNEGMIATLLMIFVNIFILGLFNVGLGYRTEICDLIRSKNGNYKTKIKKPSKNFFMIASLIISLLFLFYMIFSNDFNAIPILGLLGSISTLIFTFYCLPSIFSKLSNKSSDKINFLVFRNIKLNIEKNLGILISIYLISGLLLVNLANFKSNIYLASAFSGSLILLLFLFIIGTLYSFNSLATLKIRNFKILKQLGYINSDIKKIIFKEALGFIFCISILPSVFLFVGIFKYYYLDIIPFFVLISIVCIFLFLMLLCFGSCYVIYSKGLDSIFKNGGR
ncbi:FtsX-like permease family protein [Clostridium thermobutyricum]|uniref:FtsX-like permease family protein n=1 Tax=Clostridium thermobutyricum TaxID=29372 RepID=UPI003F528426